MAKYKVTQTAVESLLADVHANRIAIPELQRPFVWSTVQVRDLMDSLYNGYPVGYLITWQSVGAKLKGGQVAAYQQILIDGQQRVTALRAAVAGLPVVNKKYAKQRIRIAFNPATEAFETVTPFIRRDPTWIADISEFLNAESQYSFVSDYLSANPDVDPAIVERSVNRLAAIKNAQVGIINLDDDLDVETVSEIFIRINSKGVPLSSADFAMSKIATYEDRGRNLRKLIDYFCHLAVAPHVYDDIKQNDEEFANTDYLKAIEWLRHDSEDLYDPTYSDVIRVAGLVGFNRGKASALVSALSGRDPETRTFDESRIGPAYDRLDAALMQIVKRYHFQNFIMLIKSAGFINHRMIGSKNALNFAYALYLRLRNDATMPEATRVNIVRRWFVLSLLTNRHSGSFESTWDQDIRRISEHGAAEYLQSLEQSELSEGYWTQTLPSNLATTSTISPYFQVFLASQIATKAKGFLSKSITVAAMTEHAGDIHHVVPKEYLRTHGFPDRGDYNQVANYALTETAINLAIGKRPPAEYLDQVRKQIDGGPLTLGEIADAAALKENLRENALPENLSEVDSKRYREFLADRRGLMAAAIREYYRSL